MENFEAVLCYMSANSLKERLIRELNHTDRNYISKESILSNMTFSVLTYNNQLLDTTCQTGYCCLFTLNNGTKVLAVANVTIWPNRELHISQLVSFSKGAGERMLRTILNKGYMKYNNLSLEMEASSIKTLYRIYSRITSDLWYIESEGSRISYVYT